MGTATALISIATILGPIALVFMAISFGTDHWLEYDVDRQNLKTYYNSQPENLWEKSKTDEALYYFHSRDVGMFRMCFTNTETEFLQTSSKVEDGNCFNIDYDMPSSVENPSDNYKASIHLKRCFLAFYIIGMVLFIIGFIFGLVLCCLRASRWAYVAGLLSYAAAFSIAAAIAFFHGAEYIERNKLEGKEFYSQWPPILKQNTNRDYGWSYALGWVGMILAALAATFYSLAGCSLTSEKYEDNEVLEKHGYLRERPIGMEPVYAVGADPYYTKHGYPRAYIGPMAPEFYARGYPPIGYADTSKEMWHWREIES